ncbi:MAG: SGNH/GDSL hydrolase family protein [Verrucomicrobiota bacterium]
MISNGEQGVYDPAVPEELRVRGGLPNAFQKLEAGEPVCVAYVGGSITDAEGWRVKTFDWLQQKFPDSELSQVEAAIPGTGADFAACRLSDDLLPYNPDLVFVEFRVNLGGGFEARAIEGVVRQIWEANPETDICLVYTIGDWMIEKLQNNEQFFFGEIMETMANEYGIPSIDFGVEVIKRLNNDTLVFESDQPVAGKLHFSRDGVHPIDEGHELYKEIVARSFKTMQGQGQAGAHQMPEPLAEDHFGRASLIPVEHLETIGGWVPVDVENDPVYTADKKRSHAMLRGALKTAQVGDTIEFDWEGKLICFTHIPQGEGMEVTVSIDGNEPKTYQLDQKSTRNVFARFFYAPEQEDGPHTAKLTVTKLPEGTSFYVGQVMVIAASE